MLSTVEPDDASRLQYSRDPKAACIKTLYYNDLFLFGGLLIGIGVVIYT
jgi:hypothetical protein